MSTIFTRIIRREIPAHIVAEDEKNIAFLDISPVTAGHTLVVPKTEIDYLLDMSDEDYVALQRFAKKVGQALQQVFPQKRIGTAVVGLEVPHAHIHLIPFSSMAEFSFSNPKLRVSAEELAGLAARISTAFTALLMTE
jgi:histidine triad (HIT) family protein